MPRIASFLGSPLLELGCSIVGRLNRLLAPLADRMAGPVEGRQTAVAAMLPKRASSTSYPPTERSTTASQASWDELKQSFQRTWPKNNPLLWSEEQTMRQRFHSGGAKQNTKEALSSLHCLIFTANIRNMFTGFTGSTGPNK